MLNRVSMMGRLTHDPELRYTKSTEPAAFARFGLAVDRDYKNKDGSKITDFFEIVAWRKKAEFVVKYFKKGRLVYIEGRLQRDTWEDENKQKRTVYKIVAENCYFADSKKTQDNEQDKQNWNQNSIFGNAAQQNNDDDLPF